MKPKHLFAFLFATFQLFNFSTVFGQANTFWHDRIDTTIYATTTGTNTYTGTNTNTNFNVNKYVRGLLVSTFFVNGNTGASTYRLVTASGTLSTAAIRKVNGAALVSGDIPDSSAVFLMYYGNFWRLVGVYSAASSTCWSITGNAGTTAGTNFIGTTDAVGFVIKTNNTEWARMLSTGQLGLGTSTPISWLDIKKSANADTLFRASNDVTGDDSTVIILPNGRVGIGTTSPTGKLTINGLGTSSATYIAEFFNATPTSYFQFRDDGAFVLPVDGQDIIFNGGSRFEKTIAEDLTFRPAASGSFRGYNSGNTAVVLGYDDRTSTNAVAFAGQRNYDGNEAFAVSGNATSTFIQKWFAGSGSFRACITDGANFGLGTQTFGTNALNTIGLFNNTAPTTSPADMFQIYSADISAGNAALFTRAEGGEIYSIGTEFGTQSNSALNIATNSTTRFTVQTDGGTQFSYRVIEKQGTDIASAATIVIPADGNTFELTGTTAVTLITTTGWQEGATITLIANENVTITNGTATSGSDVTILLSGAANFNMTANDVLTLKLSSTTAGGQAWRESSRSVN